MLEAKIGFTLFWIRKSSYCSGWFLFVESYYPTILNTQFFWCQILLVVSSIPLDVNVPWVKWQKRIQIALNICIVFLKNQRIKENNKVLQLFKLFYVEILKGMLYIFWIKYQIYITQIILHVKLWIFNFRQIEFFSFLVLVKVSQISFFFFLNKYHT